MFPALAGLSSLIGGASSVLSGLGGFGEKLFDNYTAAKAATKAFDRDVWMMGNRYQLQVKDMLKAGLNPMLAAGASPPSPNAPMANVSRGGGVQGVSQLASAAQARATVDLLRSQTRKTDAETVTEMNRPENVASGTAHNVASAGQAEAQTKQIVALIEKIPTEIEALRAEIRYKGASADTLDRLRELEARIKQLDAKGRELRLPEDQARGEAGKAISRGGEVINEAPGRIGSWISERIRSLLDEVDRVQQDAARRKKGVRGSPGSRGRGTFGR